MLRVLLLPYPFEFGVLVVHLGKYMLIVALLSCLFFDVAIAWFARLDVLAEGSSVERVGYLLKRLSHPRMTQNLFDAEQCSNTVSGMLMQ